MGKVGIALGGWVGLDIGANFGLPGLFFGSLIGMSAGAIVFGGVSEENDRIAELEQRVNELEEDLQNE